MTTDRPRPFTLGDAALLIVAASVGLALVRDWVHPSWCAHPMPMFGGQAISNARQSYYELARMVSWTIPFAIPMTAALLIARARSPRPRWRRIARQPGAVGCAAALLGIAFPFGREVFCWVLAYLCRPNSAIHLPSPPFARYDNPGFHPPAGEWLRRALLEVFPLLISPVVSVAVAASWCALKASGRWRPEPGWIDRAGRCLSAYWMALGVAIAILGEVWKFLM